MGKLREQGSEVTKAEGEKLADKLEVQYLECSALSQQNLKSIFQSITRFARVYKKIKEQEDDGDKKCIVF